MTTQTTGIDDQPELERTFAAVRGRLPPGQRHEPAVGFAYQLTDDRTGGW